MHSFPKKALLQVVIILSLIAVPATLLRYYQDDIAPPPIPSVTLATVLQRQGYLIINTTGTPTGYSNEVMWDTRQLSTHWQGLNETLKKLQPKDEIILWSGRTTTKNGQVRTTLQALGIKNIRMGL